MIVVTGASGFIGREVCTRLMARGLDVLGVVGPHGSGSPFPFPTTSPTALNDRGSFRRLLDRLSTPPRAVIHLAARLPSAYSGPDADAASREIAAIDQEVIPACEERRVRMVYGSSTSVYGAGLEIPMEESQALSPEGAYPEAKVAGEALALRCSRSGYAILRICAPYGPGQATGTVVRVFLERALRNESLLVHGTGSREQDFTHVQDVAEALSRAATGAVSGVFNVAGGLPVTMRRLAEVVVAAVTGCRSEILPSGQPDPQEGRRARFSTLAARRVLGWVPEISLPRGIEELASRLTRGAVR
jgi:UDP-glucose 4-epimerase